MRQEISSALFKGPVLAHVQGTEPATVSSRYRLSRLLRAVMWLKPCPSERFCGEAASREMPQILKKCLRRMVCHYFPSLCLKSEQMLCPIKPTPQAHQAIYYQLGDYFSEDPFLISVTRVALKIRLLLLSRELIKYFSPSEQLIPLKHSIPNSLKTASFWQYNASLRVSTCWIVHLQVKQF